MTADDDDRSGCASARTRSPADAHARHATCRSRRSSCAPPGARARSARARPREARRIVALCRRPLSVAEVSAHLHLPLGVARVLVGDMTDEGLRRLNRPQAGRRPPQTSELLERVLDGLQAL